jgi:hypothetical protein
VKIRMRCPLACILMDFMKGNHCEKSISGTLLDFMKGNLYEKSISGILMDFMREKSV